LSSYDPFEQPPIDITKLKQRAKAFGPMMGSVALVLLLLVAVTSSYYQIEPEEIGVVLRFGKHVETADPGPHFKIPFGVDRVVKVPVQRQLKMEFGFRTRRADVRSEYTRNKQTYTEAEMLTGDLNVGVVEWIVQYKITDPAGYLFRFRNIDHTLRLMSEAMMRNVVGDHSVDELLTGGREAIEAQSKLLLQDLNKRYDTGITIEHVKLQDVNVPDSARPALREVEEAKQERERMINEAEADYNKAIPEARGVAKRRMEAAEGYRTERVNHAKGDAQRFRDLYAEYRKAPSVTRTRLYLEALSEVLPRAKNVYLVDSKTSGVLPLLNLDGGKRP